MCLPAWTRRRSDSGALVRRATRDRRVPTVVDSGTVMAKAVSVLAWQVDAVMLMKLTVAGDVLDEELHGCLGLGGRGAR